MRVISGKYKGKNIIGFDIDGTRPTMDRVKESLMAMIQNKIKDSIVLDLFAGSGSLGIEAISNGAKACYFVDKNIELIKIIQENTKNIDEDIKIIHSDYKKALENFKNIKFDIIFLDPPYKFNLINDALKQINELNLLSENGIIVCEFETELLDTNSYQIYKEKKYGSKKVIILKK